MKYFVIADPHGFFTITRKALEKKGFEVGNPEHKLILCGDAFDRGKEPVEMLDFLYSLGDQLIYIRGNHEDLYLDCEQAMEKAREIKEDGSVGYNPWNIPVHHYNNGTVYTVSQIYMAGKSDKVKELFSKAIDYYETDHYIFVHGWIPTKSKFDDYGLNYMYDPDWRIANPESWKSARWINGFECWQRNQNNKIKIGKTIVCGHWHAGYGKVTIQKKQPSEAILKKCDDIRYAQYYMSATPFEGKEMINLDSCTVVTKKVNVLVVED